MALAIAALPHASHAGLGGVACYGGGITVEASTEDEERLLCDIAGEAVTAMASCFLPQVRPIYIEATDRIDHPFATCLAAFDCDFDRIRIVMRDSYAGLVEPGDPYADFPVDVLVRTLLLHEIAHALIEQNSEGREVPPVDHEYIAAAMELAHMDPAWRDLILAEANLDAPAESRVNIWIYRLAPRRFAANAWLHFQQPQNGCALVGRLVSGAASFDGR